VDPAARGCGCAAGQCGTSDSTCACVRANGQRVPYDADGTGLSHERNVVMECGPRCGCGEDCRFRRAQKPITRRLQVARRPATGWGVLAGEELPAGAFVCTYVGRYCAGRAASAAAAAGAGIRTGNGGGIGSSRELGDGGGAAAAAVSLNYVVEVVRGAKEVAFGVDSTVTSNVGRLFNHSCDPNM
ncbi:unnamed protein product, partial [Phaeothamnion confervicola]